MTTDIQTRAKALRLRTKTKAGSPPEDTARKLAGLIDISQALAQASDADTLFQQVAQVVCEPIHADQAFLLIQDGWGKLTICSQFSPGELDQQAVSMSICNQVFDTGEAVFIPEALDSPVYQRQESVVRLNLRSVMAAPVLAHNGPVGVLYVCSYTTGELFKDDDLALLKACAAQIGIHLERTWVLAEKDRLYWQLETIATGRGRVVEVATHELGTPLQQISLAIGVTQKHIDAIQKLAVVPDQHLDQMLLALGSALRGVHRINQHFVLPLRSFYNLDLLLNRLDLKVLGDEYWRSLVHEWQVLAGAHAFDITERLPAALEFVVDPDLFKRTLTHLIQNAVSYTKVGQRIELIVELKDDMLQIRITDEGLGIPPDDLPHLGTWLYRGSNVANIATAPSGLGIGLNSAKRIVEAHRGDLVVESVLGKGTTVTTNWPI